MKKYVKLGVVCIMCAIIVFLLYFPNLYFGVEYDQETIPDESFAWQPGSTRDMYWYVQPNRNTTLLTPTSTCSTPLLLLIVVSTRAQNRDMRDAIRDTWGSVPAGLAARVVFLLGQTQNKSLEVEIRNESAQYGDLIQERFLDTYNNLSVKSVMMLKWMTSYCRDVEYLVKSDDDMFVNIPALVRHVTELRGRVGDLLLGSVNKRVRAIRDNTNKWYSPTFMYPKRYYPTYLSGVFYVMSNDVAFRLYETALNTPLFHLEDVYLTGIVAEAAGIRRRGTKLFVYLSIKRDPCLYKKNIMVAYWHRIDAAEMRAMWQLVKNAQGCKGIVNVLL